MEKYNKEKLHEYAKELFALCLEKKIYFEYDLNDISIKTNKDYLYCNISTEYFNVFMEASNLMPIWELIEKVKQL